MNKNLDKTIMNNERSCQKAISLSRQIQEHLNKDILKEGQPFIIMKGYEWLREVMSLLSKQSNLFESCILLLKNNMEQEAYILARSQFNNMLWISYLCSGRDNARVKEYFYEPYITQLQQLININKYLKNLPLDVPQSDKFSTINLAEINSKIKSIKTTLKSEGYIIDDYNKPIKSKKIIELTEWNPILVGLYNSFYNDASKYEHADISTTRSFRKTVVDDVSTDIAFKFDMKKSDITLWKSVFNNTLTILFLSIEKILNRIKDNDKHLFDFKQFDEINFSSLIINIKIACDFVESIEESLE